MKIHRFFLSKLVLDKKEKEIEVADREIHHQVTKVLKLQKGEQLALCDGKGLEALCLLSDSDKKNLFLTVLEYRDIVDNGRQTTLYLAILKRENFELAVQKSAEIGISKLVPIISERTIKTGINLERLNKISKEACELSGRGTIMSVEPATKFTEAIKQAKENDANLFFAPGGLDFMPGKSVSVGAKSAGIFIGPEGGWSDVEIATAKENRFLITGLGKMVLRGETAATVASFLAVNY